MLTIQRVERGTKTEREFQRGRVVAKSRPRIVWNVVDDLGNVVTAFDKRREANEFIDKVRAEIATPSTYLVETKHPTDFTRWQTVVTVTRTLWSRHCWAAGFGRSRDYGRHEFTDGEAIRAFFYEHGCRVVCFRQLS